MIKIKPKKTSDYFFSIVTLLDNIKQLLFLFELVEGNERKKSLILRRRLSANLFFMLISTIKILEIFSG